MTTPSEFEPDPFGGIDIADVILDMKAISGDIEQVARRFRDDRQAGKRRPPSPGEVVSLMNAAIALRALIAWLGAEQESAARYDLLGAITPSDN